MFGIVIYLAAVFVFLGVYPCSAQLTTNSPFAGGYPIPGGKSLRLSFDHEIYDALRSTRSININGFLLEREHAVDLILRQFYVFDGNTKFIVTADGTYTAVEQPDVVLLTGTIANDPNSRVFLGISPNGSNGYIETVDGYYVLATHRSGAIGAKPEITITRIGEIPWTTNGAWCGGDVLVPGRVWSSEGASRGEGSRQDYKVCDLAIDADFEFYADLFDSNRDDALTYIAELVGAVSTRYDLELESKLWLSYVRVWTTSSDPYTKEGNTLEALEEFRDYWRDNMTATNRTIAHKLSGTSGGGRAYVDALCDDQWGYGVSCVDGSFPWPYEPGPANWDLIVVAHEIGHNYGSRHTHCYSPPIDQCYNQENGCYSGPVDCLRGTIMSYCHVCSLLGVENIDLVFGSRVISRIRTSIDGASCMVVARNESYVDGSYHGTEDGSTAHPWNSVTEGIRGVMQDGTVFVRPGTYSEEPRIYEIVQLQKWGSGPGTVIIGE